MKKNFRWKDILMLQAVFLIYSGSSVVAKFASNEELFSLPFILFYGLDVVILGIYALLWQQVIKNSNCPLPTPIKPLLCSGR